MAGRKRHQLFALDAEERVGADKERAGAQFDQAREGRLDFAFAACFQDGNLQPKGARRRLYRSHLGVDSSISWVHQQTIVAACGTNSRTNSNRFGSSSEVSKQRP